MKKEFLKFVIYKKTKKLKNSINNQSALIAIFFIKS